jgi:hypothetical protein
MSAFNKFCTKHKCWQEATSQCLLNKHATQERQEVAHCQFIIDEGAARAQSTTASQTIFMWLCHQQLQIQLVRMIAQRQLRDLDLACLRHDHKCYKHA